MKKVILNKKALDEVLNVAVDVKNNNVQDAVRQAKQQTDREVGSRERNYVIPGSEINEEDNVVNNEPTLYLWEAEVYDIEEDIVFVRTISPSKKEAYKRIKNHNLVDEIITFSEVAVIDKSHLTKTGFYLLDMVGTYSTQYNSNDPTDKGLYQAQPNSYGEYMEAKIFTKKQIMEGDYDSLNYNQDPEYGTYADPFESNDYYPHQIPENIELFVYRGLIVKYVPDKRGKEKKITSSLFTIAQDINTAFERFKNFDFHGTLMHIEAENRLSHRLTELGYELYKSGEVVESSSESVPWMDDLSDGAAMGNDDYKRIAPNIFKETKFFTKKQLQEAKLKKLRENSTIIPKNKVVKMLKEWGNEGIGGVIKILDANGWEYVNDRRIKTEKHPKGVLAMEVYPSRSKRTDPKQLIELIKQVVPTAWLVGYIGSEYVPEQPRRIAIALK